MPTAIIGIEYSRSLSFTAVVNSWRIDWILRQQDHLKIILRQLACAQKVAPGFWNVESIMANEFHLFAVGRLGGYQAVANSDGQQISPFFAVEIDALRFLIEMNFEES